MFYLNSVLDRAVIVDCYYTRYVIPSSPDKDPVKQSVAGEDFARRIADGTAGMKNYRKVEGDALKVMPVDTLMVGRAIDVIA